MKSGINKIISNITEFVAAYVCMILFLKSPKRGFGWLFRRLALTENPFQAVLLSLNDRGLLSYLHLFSFYSTGLIFLYCLLRYRKKTLRVYYKSLKIEGKKVLFVIMITACFVQSITCLFYLISLRSQTVYQNATAGLNRNIIACLLLDVLFVPMAEEFFFRGFIYETFREKMSFWEAALFSSILFGLFHDIQFQIIYTFFFGMLLALIKEVGHSLFYPILGHVIFNLLGSRIIFADPPFLIIVVGSILFFILLYLLLKARRSMENVRSK